MSKDLPFHWECHPKAESILLELLEACCAQSPYIHSFRYELREKTSTRLFDWVDHLVAQNDSVLVKRLVDAGFVQQEETPSSTVWQHPGAQLPRLMLHDDDTTIGVAVKVEWIADFLQARGIERAIEGSPLSVYRRCQVSLEQDVALWVVERRGSFSMEPAVIGAGEIAKLLHARELWACRERDGLDDQVLMQSTLDRAKELVSHVGKNMAAWIVMEVERAYWQRRNHAAQVQKARQDALGMGWANHDHHTFRSSRHLFPQLVELFELLGFHRRERFYAGDQAGWGAQVMENSEAALVLFLDLDLAPDEATVDFVDHALPDLAHPGTVGLWCALHGDSILKAGMHHLEGQFYFDQLREDLQHQSVGMMQPFSDFDYLKQAFTTGEWWPVDPARIDRLMKQGVIDQAQAEDFRKKGAIGSHLENLQRREGYKGFNKKNVSSIIEKTDPRKA